MAYYILSLDFYLNTIGFLFVYRKGIDHCIYKRSVWATVSDRFPNIDLGFR